MRDSLITQRSAALTQLLGAHSKTFLQQWDFEAQDSEVFVRAIARDQTLLASFQAGAVYAIERLREGMPREAREEGLAECVDALEADVHRQFTGRLVVYARMLAEAQVVALARAGEDGAEGDGGPRDGDAQGDGEKEERNVGEAAAEGGKSTSKQRKRAKSRKAKKVKQKQKQAKEEAKME